jgi:phage head maturation protease
MTDRPKPGAVEDRSAPEAGAPVVDGRKLRGLIPYGVESREMPGGFREVIDRGALENADLSDLIATREHDRTPLLGRHPTTLTTEDRADGFHWAADLPSSPAGEDVRVAVERGDLRASSWRQVVARDYWVGDVRHIAEISHLLDVTVTAAPLYTAAAAEFRSQPDPANGQEHNKMAETADTTAATTATETTTATTTAAEDRSVTTTSSGLQVEARVSVANEPRRGLAAEFRHRGFPGEVAVMSWDEYEDRAVTWTGSVDNVATAPRRESAALGFDQRYAWPAFGRIGVDAGVTSVPVMSQTARALASAATVVRAVDAITNKPETGSTITVANVPMKQLANVQSGVPNVFLETAAITSTIENDLRLAFAEGLDKVVIDTFAASGFQAPGTDNPLVSYRKAITTLRAAGYNPDTLILTPAADEALDVMVSGISGGSADFVFAPGQFSSDSFFRMNRRVSKTVAAPGVVDSAAYGRLYAGPVSLARFEENAGKTNTSLIRLEGHAAFGVERQTAAVRIAAA